MRLDPNEGRVPTGERIEHRVKIKDRHGAINVQDLGTIKINTKRNVNRPDDVTTVAHRATKKMVNYRTMENRMIPLSKFTIQRTIVNQNRPIIVMMTNILLIENIKVVPDSLVLVQIQNAFYKRCDRMIMEEDSIKRRFLFLHFISDIAKKYPPSLRIIVQETNLPKLKIGELFLITYKGIAK